MTNAIEKSPQGDIKDSPKEPPSGVSFKATVNGNPIKLSDPLPEGRQVLAEAGLVPADSYVLIQLLNHGTRSIGLDETVDLREEGKKRFRAFQSDRIFRFVVDERGYDWGAAVITEPELREIASAPKDEVLVLEREGEPDLPLPPGDQVDLGKKGVEHFHTVSRLITVFLDNEPKQIERGKYTTEQLIKRLNVEAGYLLNLQGPDGKLVPLKPGETIRVKEGMKFFTQVPCGGSS
jgi:hypothetical protein